MASVLDSFLPYVTEHHALLFRNCYAIRQKNSIRSMDLLQHDNHTDTLPNELLEQVLTEAWLSPMSPPQRASFIKTIFGASRSWLATLARIIAKYVYVCSSPLNREWWPIEEWEPPFWHGLAGLSVQLCHSFTRQIAITPLKLSNGCSSSNPDHLWRKAICELLKAFHVLPYIPHLRELSIEYFNPMDANSCLSFQFSVIRLEVEYTYPIDTPSGLIEELGLTGKTKKLKVKHAPWELPDLYPISMPTTNSAFLGDILKLAPHLELSEESFGIKVKILSASQDIPHQGLIVHGPLYIACTPICRTKALSGVVAVRSRALGVVLDVGSKSSRCQDQDLIGTSRELLVFKQRAW